LTGAHDPHFERPAPPEDAVAARLAAIVESSDDAIVGKDLNGVILLESRSRASLRLPRR